MPFYDSIFGNFSSIGEGALSFPKSVSIRQIESG
jgi:hypothetical protein